MLLLMIMIMMMDWSIMNAMALGSSSLVLSIIDATLDFQDGGGIHVSDEYSDDSYQETSKITMTNCKISGNTAFYVRFTIS